MTGRSIPGALPVSVLGLLLGMTPAQDSLQLTDGRFVVGPEMSRSDKGILIHFEHGQVLVPRELVKTSTVLEPAEREAAFTEEEREKLDRGLVYFEGRWMPEGRRDDILEDRRRMRAQRIADAKAHRLWRNRYTLKTRNFAFEYTIDPEVMERYAEMLEVYFKTFTKEWRIRKPRGIGRLKVCFYHDADYFHQVSAAPRGVIGYFRFVEPIELDFYYERLDEELTQDVLFHEANHFLTHLIDPKFVYPRWVDESLAEYYGASEWDPEKKEMSVGHLQEGRLAVIQDAIKRDEWQGLEELIRLEQREFNAVHYAWGWSLVHFLMSDDRTADRFKRYYLGLAKDSSIDRVPYFRDFKQVEPEEQIEAFKKYMGIRDLEELEKSWHAYVKGLQAASASGYRKAGELALGRGMPIKAQRFFRTALEMGDTSCMTNFGYGRALYQKRKYAEAAEQFEEAIAKDPLQGRFWMYLADAREHLDAPEEEVERLRNLALEIDPDDYDLMLRLVWRTREKSGG